MLGMVGSSVSQTLLFSGAPLTCVLNDTPDLPPPQYLAKRHLVLNIWLLFGATFVHWPPAGSTPSPSYSTTH